MASTDTSHFVSVAGAVWFSVSQTVAIRRCNLAGYKIDIGATVFLTELLKMCSIVIICCGFLRKTPFPGPVRWGFCVNALLYIGTNIISFVVLESLDAGTYMILVQHKVVLVMALSSAVLGKSYSWTQWLGCLMLVAGIVLVLFRPSGLQAVPPNVMGLVFAQGLCSSFSGVWMEKMLRRSDDGDAFYDFLADSFQMYAFSLPCYAALSVRSSGTHTLPVIPSVALVVNGAFCGLFIGSVFKYFSAATRTFVQGAAVVLSVWISVVLGWQVATWKLGGGTLLVVLGICAFGARSK